MFTQGAEIEYSVNAKSKHRDLIILLKPFVYKPVTQYFGIEVLPIGLVVDNASVPDFGAWLVHPNDKRLREPSWHHDYVPKNKTYFMEKYGYTDAELFHYSNIEMRENCRAHGVSKWKCDLIYFAINNTKQAKQIWAAGGQLNS